MLVDAAYEVAAATRACAVARSNKELAKRVDFSRSDVGKGRDTEVVARCQDIWTAATENVGSLGNYGVTQAKVNALKKKIEDFQAVQAKPRQGKATSSSATKELSKLAVQFKGTQPAFWHAYNTARVIVDTPAGGRSGKAAPGAAGAISKAA